MDWSWINIRGAVVMGLLLLPNIIFAVKSKDVQNRCTNKVMNISEQVGRYGTIFLMFINIKVFEYDFAAKLYYNIWLVAVAVLITAYWICWVLYINIKSDAIRLLLAVFPSLIFILSGALMRHWILLGFAVIFSVSHIFVTVKNSQALKQNSIDETTDAKKSKKIKLRKTKTVQTAETQENTEVSQSLDSADKTFAEQKK